jgi:precorrin-8X/cobalt-precorrin-8 methylmutase
LREPHAIEEKSLGFVGKLLAEEPFCPEEKFVLARIIHATGDPGFRELFECHPEFVFRAVEALKAGAAVIADVKMVAAGINRRLLKRLGGRVRCAISSAVVVAEAQDKGCTRAMAAMDHLAPLMEGSLVAIGNAPTALFRVLELYRDGRASPAAVVGVPVGFVGAAETKEALRASRLPYLTVKGSKGGSSVAAAAVNALLRLAAGEAHG